MNKSIMMGRLVRDPEINYTTKKDGDEFVVANFRIAVDRKYSDETDFFSMYGIRLAGRIRRKVSVSGH